MHGTAYANRALDRCDLIVCVGARFDDRVTGDLSRFAPEARVIHIDVDPAEIGKVRLADVPVVGDARSVLADMLAEFASVSGEMPDYSEWIGQIDEWKQEFPLLWSEEGGRICRSHEAREACGSDRCGSTICEGMHGAIKPPAVIRALWEATDGNAFVTTDVGQHQMWAMQHYLVREPNQFISSAGLGTMGFGLPAAIGAQFGQPDREVWCVTGDGSIQMNIQELATAVIHNLPIRIALLNNGCLGMVRQWQTMFYDGRYSQTGLNVGTPDFVRLAESYGCVAIRVEDMADVPDAINRARQVTDRPVLVEFMCEAEENVYPMIPAGKSIDEMMLK